MSNKRYFIRYNRKADRLEEIVTEGRHAPKSGDYKEIFIGDDCCHIANVQSCNPEEIVLTSNELLVLVGQGVRLTVLNTISSIELAIYENGSPNITAVFNDLVDGFEGIGTFTLTETAPDTFIITGTLNYCLPIELILETFVP